MAKRSDGYHDIETVFYPVLLQDALEIKPMRPLDPAQLRKRIEAGLLVQPDDAFIPYRLLPRREEIPCCSLEITGNDFPFKAADNLVVIGMNCGPFMKMGDGHIKQDKTAQAHPVGRRSWRRLIGLRIHDKSFEPPIQPAYA